MTPDKIYIREYPDGDYSLLWEEQSYEDELAGIKSAEYIRKDALVEWLNERINDGDEEGLMTNQIANLAYKDVIDKLNSM